MLNSFILTFKDLASFLKSPREEIDLLQKNLHKIKNLFLVLLIDILATLVILLIINFFESLKLITTENHKLLELIELYPLWVIIFLGVLFIPFIEEIIFRLHLRFRNFYIAKIIIYLIYVTGIKEREKIQNSAENIWQNRYGIIFYFTAILFGLVHLTNYDYSINILIFFPVLILPQFTVGLLSGYLRVRFGFIWGFFLHALHNAIFLLIPLIFMSGAIEKENLKTNEFTLIVEESGLRASSNELTQNLNADSININNLELNKIIAFLTDKDEQFIKFDNNKKAGLKLNIYYKSKIGNNSLNKMTILNNLRELYLFKIQTKFETIVAYKLIVIDSLKLNKYKSIIKNFKNSSITSGQDFIITENTGLDELCEFLSSEYGKHIFYSAKDKSKYNFKIPAKDISDVIKYLDSNLGLSLSKTEKKVEYTIVIFR